MTSRERFLQLLRQDILKLDLAELDFGIYRVLNYRRAEIESFLQERLPAHIAEVLDQEGANRNDALRASLERLATELTAMAEGLGYHGAFDENDELTEALRSSPKGTEYLRLVDELERSEASTGFADTEEDALFNHLFTFFSRYYEDGDFIPLARRGAPARYVVPYNGEDVHFSWRGKGSHYVKTAEQLFVYRARCGAVRLQLELVNAELEEDNTKREDRLFVPSVKKAAYEDGIYRIPFEFRALSDTETKRATANASSGKAPRRNLPRNELQTALLAAAVDKLTLPAGLDPALLAFHFQRYARRNREDYFVHPNLSAFLSSELDHYLLTEYLTLDDLTGPEVVEDRFVKARALRALAREVITFLGQIEDFQALLFEKAKFVTGHDYLVQVDLVRDLWPEVLESEAQRDQWQSWLGLESPTADTLEENPGLLVDTRLFEAEFKYRVLEQLDDIESLLDGVLIKGENFAALRTVRAVFTSRIKVAYLDPPYNTGNDGFLYKDEFSRHSTWAAMLDERLHAARRFLADDAIVAISIDENEVQTLGPLLDRALPKFIGTVIVQTNPKGRGLDESLATSHDYLMIAAVSPEAELAGIPKTDEEIARNYRNEDKHGQYRLLELRNTHREFNRKTRENLWYPLYVHPSTGAVQPERARGLISVTPIWPDGLEGCWTWGKELAGRDRHLLVGREANDRGWVVYRKDYARDEGGDAVRKKPKTIWTEPDVQTEKGQKLLDRMFGDRVFQSPKPVGLLEKAIDLSPSAQKWVLDFFAGSGTTGHAVINLNRVDGGDRRFLLCEMGGYFDSILVPRIAKASYAPEWDDGKPTHAETNGNGDGPRLVKLLAFESYDESLDSLELPSERSDRLAGVQQLYGDDFVIKYLLPEEAKDAPVLLNIGQLEDPFAYSLSLHTPDGVVDCPVDCVETFNLLLGVQVEKVRHADDDGRRYVFVTGRVDDETVLIVWRPLPNLDPARDKAFVMEHFAITSFGRVYVNGDSAIRSARSLDPVFKDLFLSRAPQ